MASGAVAAADEALKSGRLKLGSSSNYDESYKDFYEAWNGFYTATMLADAAVNIPQFARTIRQMDVISSAKKLHDAAKAAGKEAEFAALWKGGDIANNASKLVDNLDLGKFIKKIGDYEVYENGEVFYRTMSKEHYDELVKTNKMLGTGETTTSPNIAFSENYEGYLVQFKMKRGTIEQLENIGIAGRNHPDILAIHPSLKKDISPWNEDYARFKLEKEQVNIALGKGKALEIFNNNIEEFKFIKEIKKIIVNENSR